MHFELAYSYRFGHGTVSSSGDCHSITRNGAQEDKVIYCKDIKEATKTPAIDM